MTPAILQNREKLVTILKLKSVRFQACCAHRIWADTFLAQRRDTEGSSAQCHRSIFLVALETLPWCGIDYQSETEID